LWSLKDFLIKNGKATEDCTVATFISSTEIFPPKGNILWRSPFVTVANGQVHQFRLEDEDTDIDPDPGSDEKKKKELNLPPPKPKSSPMIPPSVLAKKRKEEKRRKEAEEVEKAEKAKLEEIASSTYLSSKFSPEIEGEAHSSSSSESQETPLEEKEKEKE
jgi:hypothetical protein